MEGTPAPAPSPIPPNPLIAIWVNEQGLPAYSGPPDKARFLAMLAEITRAVATKLLQEQAAQAAKPKLLIARAGLTNGRMPN